MLYNSAVYGFIFKKGSRKQEHYKQLLNVLETCKAPPSTEIKAWYMIETGHAAADKEIPPV